MESISMFMWGAVFGALLFYLFFRWGLIKLFIRAVEVFGERKVEQFLVDLDLLRGHK